MKILSLILSCAILISFAGCATKKDSPQTAAEKIAAVAKVYGMDSISQINKLSFTFNIKKDFNTSIFT